jgi:hypothetical protein
MSAIHTINVQLSGLFLAEDLDANLNDMVSDLMCIIANPFVQSEHDEALTLLCNACVQRFTDFDGYARAIINDLLPALADVAPDQTFRLFSIAFIASFGLLADDAKQAVLARYVQILGNRRSRGVDFSPPMITEALKGLALMLSMAPAPLVAVDMFEDIYGVIDKALKSSKTKVLTAALDCVPVVFEAIGEVEEPAMDGLQFAGNFAGKFRELPGQVQKKADQKAVNSKCNQIRKVFDGDENSIEIVLNSQVVTIAGDRRLTVLAAIRRISGDHFQQQMSENQFFHEYFGFELMTLRTALREKARLKDEIRYDRAVSKQERKKAIAKQRKQKSKRTEAIDDDD